MAIIYVAFRVESYRSRYLDILQIIVFKTPKVKERAGSSMINEEDRSNGFVDLL